MELAEIFKKRTKGFLSIDFGQSVTKIAYMKSAGDGFKLLNYDLKNILSTEKKREETVDFINNFLKTNTILEKEVYITISDLDSVIIKSLILPVLPKGEILQAAKWQLKEDVPFDLEGALFNWQIVKEYTDQEGTKKNGIIFVVIKVETIDKYLSISHECKLNPEVITIGPFNYANLLRYSEENLQTQAILDMGYKDATLSIYKNNKLNFVRRLAFSSDRLTQSLTSTLVSDRGKIELSYEEAEDVKVTFGIPLDETSVLKDNIQAIQVISLMRPLLETLVRELRFSFDYFTSNFNEESPLTLYITGGGANLKNLDRYLHKELNINVSKLPLPGFINTQALEKEKLNKDQSQIISALGAMLAGPQAINLAPEEIKMQKLELIEKASLRLISFTVGAIFLLSLFIVRFQIGIYKNRLRDAQAYLQTMGEIKVLGQRVNPLENLVYTIQKDKVPTDGLLKLISTLLPGNIILDELILDQDSHNLILKGRVSGRQDNTESVLSKFIEKIEASSFFIKATLVSSKKIGEVQEFEIKCELTHQVTYR
jgi:type IV pilus assembly protein PilM